MGTSDDKRKAHQAPMTIEEHIENLRVKGLNIEDAEYARSTLQDISYFRLIKAYSLGLKAKNGNYRSGVRFEDIVQLYLFDAKFRQVLFGQIERIEINLRCRLANHFSLKYGILGYEDANNFDMSNDDFQAFNAEIQREINRKRRTPFIINFQDNYIGGTTPMYALVEVLSFGVLSKFYKNMKSEDKKAIAAQFGVSYSYFESWIEHLSYVRNICAHYGRLYNAKLAKTPRLYKQYTSSNITNTRAFATLLVLKHLLTSDRHWHDFVQTISLLIEKYPSVKLRRLGFSQDWENILLK